VALENRSAGTQHDQSGVRLPEPVTAEIQARVGQQVPGRHPVGDQLGREPGEEFLQGSLPARQQPMDVAPVRDATPVHRRLGQPVPVDHRHLRIGVGEHPGGEHPRQASAEHHRAVSDLPVHRSHLLGCRQAAPRRCSLPRPEAAQLCSLVSVVP
jgi:hypothetical protein